MNTAVMTGADPRMAAPVVGLSASNTFVLPTHQVNAPIMRPGGYRTVDYAKAGFVMTIIFLVVKLSILDFALENPSRYRIMFGPILIHNRVEPEFNQKEIARLTQLAIDTVVSGLISREESITRGENSDLISGREEHRP